MPWMFSILTVIDNKCHILFVNQDKNELKKLPYHVIYTLQSK